MRKKSFVSSALLFVLVCHFPAESAMPNSPTDEEQIAAIRERSNQAIARHDVAGVVAAFDVDYHVTAGSGMLFHEDHDERAQHWQEIFAQSNDIVYVRTPGRIEISTYLPRAAENGRWVGSWTTAAGRKELGGSYSASWSKVDGEWKIRSEIFVTLFCNGPGC